LRSVFFDKLCQAGRKDSRIILVNPDTAGFHCTDFVVNLPQQYVNVGIAEQNSIGLAAGLAQEGKIPFVFNILTFTAFRCYEQVRLDVCSMDLPVSLVGVGLGYDYSTLGPSHQATEDVAVMRLLPGITILSPSDDRLAGMMVDYCIEKPGPKYLRLDRIGAPLVYEHESPDLERGFHQLRVGRHLCIIATGRMIIQALEVARLLRQYSIEAGVIDLFRIKPFPAEDLGLTLANYPQIVTLEEHFVTGGLGSAVLEALSEQRMQKQILRLGIPDKFCRVYGHRDDLLKENLLDTETLVTRIIDFLETA